MKSRRSSSNTFNKNKRKIKTSGLGKNRESKSKSTARRTKTKTKNRSSNSNNRKLSLKRNFNSNSKKRAANKQSGVITIRRSSGRREKFNMERMVQTVSRSGVPFIMARDIIGKQQSIDKSSVSTKHSRRNAIIHDQSKRGRGIMT